ncbi:MAG: DUF4845 domain-containing protein [Thioalkalispiraceae bacterium]|jgi:hypothetical protein
MKQVGKQKGMTAIGWVFVFALIAIVTLVTLKLLPIYLDGFSVKSSLASLENEHNIGKMSPLKIKSMLLKRLDINMVTDVTKDDIYIDRSNGAMTIEVDYEVREKLIGNLDVVVMFNSSIEVPSK